MKDVGGTTKFNDGLEPLLFVHAHIKMNPKVGRLLNQC